MHKNFVFRYAVDFPKTISNYFEHCVSGNKAFEISEHVVLYDDDMGYCMY